MNYLCLGSIVDTHGIKGEVRILLKEFCVFDITEKRIVKIENLVKSLFVLNKELFVGREKQKLIITSYRHHKIYEMLCFEGINNINDVLKYKKEKCYVKEDVLKNNYIPLSVLLGYKIIYNDKDYGKIVDYQNNNGNIIFEIEGKKKYFIPVNSNFIEEINKINKEIRVKNIEGLII